MNFLTLDIGNSKAKLAVFDREQVIFKKTLASNLPAGLADVISKFNIKHSIISSVKEIPSSVIDLLDKHTELVVLHGLLELPIRITYKDKEKLGSDRIAGVVAAKSRFPGHPVLVIDSGSCITYDIADANGNFLGGQISPGLSMRLKAMKQFTDALPAVAVPQEAPLLGRSTAEAMQSGVFYGIVHEMNGFIRQYYDKYEDLKVLLTGGNSQLFVPSLKYEIFADPNLIMTGLNLILQYHVERHQ